MVKYLEIRYSNAGAGYTFTPSITFTLPTSDTFGDYEYNEVVTGQRSGATGYVREWDADDRILKLATVNGTFQRGESVVGAGASYKVSTVDTNEFLDEFADNIDIESEQTKLLTLVRLIHLENSNVWDLFLSRNTKKDSNCFRYIIQ